MTLGLVGVGKIGKGILRRLAAAGHTVQAFDSAAAARADIVAHGGRPVDSLASLVMALTVPRIVWLMVPAPAVAEAVTALTPLLEPGDTVIDGGNSFFKETRQRAVVLAERGIRFIDAGVSGGVAGAEHGYALMVGGEDKDIVAVKEVFAALHAPEAFAHVGPSGAGHFVKMVHNAVEYGMMQAIGEGFALLKSGPFPDIPLATVAQLWSQGTIVRSFLMELTAKALARDADLQDIAAYVEDSGEGRWSVSAAVEAAVPFWVNTAALYARFDSRTPEAFSAKLIAALRREFGGHAVKGKND
ncbi:MAG: decarboxylating 6-phosphogluconate dehydrogenase [Candidatus Andersenbacteria bacterium]